MLLPTERVEVEASNPRKLLIAAHPGIGKSTICAGLSGEVVGEGRPIRTLIVDYENSTENLDGYNLNLRKKLLEVNAQLEKAGNKPIDMVQLISFVIKEMEKLVTQNDGEPFYDFIVHDTVSAMEKLAEDYSGRLYMSSAVGKAKLKKDEIIKNPALELSQGYGYRWLYQAFVQLTEKFEGFARYSTIFLAHVKQSSILKNAEDLSAYDVDITGKFKHTLIRECAAGGTLYPDENDPNKRYLDFTKSGNRELYHKGRAPHLAKEPILISEYKEEDDHIYFHWDRVFPDWVPKTKLHAKLQKNQ